MRKNLRFAALFLLLGSGSAFAQTQPAPPDSVRSVVRTHRNVVRLDGLAVLTRNLSNLLSQYTALPILLGYERQIGPHLSGNVEVLLNGGDPDERLAGLALQMRYYFSQSHRQTGLAGFYLAPMISSRLVKRDYKASYVWYTPSGYVQHRTLGGAGGLVGVQMPIGKKGRLLFDAAFGLMTWKQLNNSAVPASCKGCTNDATLYEQSIFVPDARLSLGYRF